jgi:hypothetical protein
VASLIVFAAITTRWFLFLGEADRYLEYAVVPAFIVCGVLVPPEQRSTLLWGVVALHAVQYGVYVSLFVRRRRRRRHQLDDLMEALEQQPPSVVLNLLGSAPWELAYRARHRIFASENVALSPQSYEELFWRYPLPRPKLREYACKHGVRLVVVSKQAVESARKEGCRYEFERFVPVFEDEYYALYRVQEASESQASTDRGSR